MTQRTEGLGTTREPAASGAVPEAIAGIHHVTAISGPAQATVDFYAGVLGLRLIKRTINFDDPGTYHLYFGDRVGRPGTLLTFFPWEGAPSGRIGAGQVTATALVVPRGSLGFWRDRLSRLAVTANDVARFGEAGLALRDRDGLALELFEAAPDPESDARAWTDGPVAPEHAIRNFHGVTLTPARAIPSTAGLVGELLGYERIEAEGHRVRFRAPGGGPAEYLDIVTDPEASSGRMGVGTVHHVALRTADDARQAAWQGHLRGRGVMTTDVQERCYFRSIYFRERGGILFEIATDPPGMTLDESEAELGSQLRLPPWYERLRPEIERRLPALRLPDRA